MPSTTTLPLAAPACCGIGVDGGLTREAAETSAALLKAVADPVRLQLLSAIRATEQRRGVRLRPHPCRRALPADGLAPPQGARRGRAARAREARHLGVVPPRAQPARRRRRDLPLTRLTRPRALTHGSHRAQPARTVRKSARGGRDTVGGMSTHDPRATPPGARAPVVGGGPRPGGAGGRAARGVPARRGRGRARLPARRRPRAARVRTTAGCRARPHRRPGPLPDARPRGRALLLRRTGRAARCPAAWSTSSASSRPTSASRPPVAATSPRGRTRACCCSTACSP